LDILGIKNQELRIKSLEDLFASGSSRLAVAPSTNNEEEPDILRPSEERVRGEALAVLGLSVEREATVSGNLRVQKNALVEGILNVVDTLTANNIIVSKMADFFGTVIFHGDVAFQGRPTFNNDTAGVVVVKKGEEKVEVTFEKEYDHAPVVSANIILDQITKAPDQSDEDQQKAQSEVEQKMLQSGIKYVVTRRTAKGFTILLSKPLEDDTTFSWTALAVAKANDHH
jgi:hypothetical protein